MKHIFVECLSEITRDSINLKMLLFILFSNRKKCGWQYSPETPSELINYGLVISDSFIIHAPAPTNELKLTIVDQFLDLVADSVMLIHPPFPPECCLHINEPDIKKLLLSNKRIFHVYPFQTQL